MHDTPLPTATGSDTDDVGEGLSLPELTTPRWWHFGDQASKATWGVIGRRMPALVRQAFALAWRSSPRDVVATAALNAGVGAATAWALVATTDVLGALFAAVPTPDRVLAALPSLALLGAALVLRGVCSAAAGRAQARLEPQVVLTAEKQLLRRCTAVELRAFDDSGFHDHLYRCYVRGSDEAGALVRHTADVLTGAAGLVAAAGVLGVLHPVLLPLLALAVVPQWWGSAAAARMRYRMLMAFTEGRRRKILLENLMTDRRSAAEVRSFTMEGRLLAEFDRVGGRELDIQLGLATRQSLIRLAGDTAGGLVTGAVFAALALLLVDGVVEIAVAGAAVVAIRVAQGALGNALSSLTLVYESGLYFSDFVAFDEEARRRLPRAGLAPAPEGFDEIRVEHVTFSYPGQDGERPALDDVNLTLRRGRTVALVGENGSGKTTLSKLLSGLYLPGSGRVRWDGTDLASVDGTSLRERIAVIAQDHTHWPLTARRNVVMGSPGADPGRLERAARASRADAVVAELGRGWETLLDKRFVDGAEPSGGQWQRLAAARGFYRGDDGERTPLLIADEPTAALDARAEHAFFSSLHAHAGRTGAAVVLITHRLASVRMADHIVVLDRGRVVEQGGHAELLAADGLYRELWDLQASAYRFAEEGEPAA
ncbi:ABC transporter ATP-binding protein [Nocardiopsis sp. HUAS JQ3]|uniref:ATP-binding cassette domain-containing protein n=1 Tax=Nocardiopsis sp. HUAS JQ3 TaxID=3061629 RepID=UPI0023A99113|nr:ABC transporter ATP-binding protein [Nocardiopsis sp. HUAS JQ3]WDZ88745.1 ABC transporter ATP-binding protein [Nocardiopsis sp. HUAS JQ3]